MIVDPAAEPRQPRGRIGVKDVLCVGPIIANTIYYYAGLPLTPLLLGRNPVLLSALRGSIASMVAAGGFARVGRVPLVLALIAPIPISMLTDPFFFWAGKRYGRSLINYLSESDPRWRKRAARGERFFKKYGVWTIVLAPILPAPSPLFYMAAGEAGMPFLLFIVPTSIGTLVVHRSHRRRGLGDRSACRHRCADDQQLRALDHRRRWWSSSSRGRCSRHGEHPAK